MDRAGGWSPDSIPGQNAIREFEAFMRETQARAVEAFVRVWNAEPMSSCPWWVDSKADEYAEHIRAGHQRRSPPDRMNALPPLVPPRPVSERPVIDWDKPVGYAHAATLITLAR